MMRYRVKGRHRRWPVSSTRDDMNGSYLGSGTGAHHGSFHDVHRRHFFFLPSAPASYT